MSKYWVFLLYFNFAFAFASRENFPDYGYISGISDRINPQETPYSMLRYNPYTSNNLNPSISSYTFQGVPDIFRYGNLQLGYRAYPHFDTVSKQPNGRRFLTNYDRSHLAAEYGNNHPQKQNSKDESAGSDQFQQGAHDNQHHKNDKSDDKIGNRKLLDHVNKLNINSGSTIKNSNSNNDENDEVTKKTINSDYNSEQRRLNFDDNKRQKGVNAFDYKYNVNQGGLTENQEIYKVFKHHPYFGPFMVE